MLNCIYTHEIQIANYGTKVGRCDVHSHVCICAKSDDGTEEENKINGDLATVFMSVCVCASAR